MDVSFTPFSKARLSPAGAAHFPLTPTAGWPLRHFLELTNSVQRQSKEGRMNHLVLSLAGKEDVKTLGLTKGIL